MDVVVGVSFFYYALAGLVGHCPPAAKHEHGGGIVMTQLLVDMVDVTTMAFPFFAGKYRMVMKIGNNGFKTAQFGLI